MLECYQEIPVQEERGHDVGKDLGSREAGLQK